MKKYWPVLVIVLVLLVVLMWPPIISEVRRQIAKEVVATWKQLVQSTIVLNVSVFRIEAPYTAWVLAMIAQESKGIPDAVNPKDPAYGLMQITPPLLADYNRINRKSYTVADMKEPYRNLQVGIWFFDFLYHSYNDYDKAVMAYNAGQGNIEAGRPHLKLVKEYLSLVQPLIA